MMPDINVDIEQETSSWNKSHLIDKISEREGCSRKQATLILEQWISIMEMGLVQHKKILLSGFGTFQISHRRSFVGYDPKNDVEIVVPIRHIPVFKCSRILKDKLNTRA